MDGGRECEQVLEFPRRYDAAEQPSAPPLIPLFGLGRSSDRKEMNGGLARNSVRARSRVSGKDDGMGRQQNGDSPGRDPVLYFLSRHRGYLPQRKLSNG
jgi:hypothetical protein